MIAVYCGRGVDKEAVACLLNSLHQVVDSDHQIDCVDHQDLFKQQPILLILPGGKDCAYQQDLGLTGLKDLCHYVEQGGSYLGICAFAYFASSSIDFEKGGPLQVYEEKSLKFSPGTAQGPAYGLGQYDYLSRKGARAAHISSPYGSLYGYFNGGCTFLDATCMPGCHIVSTYLDLAGSPAAIISGKRGMGTFCLSGVHLEIDAQNLDLLDPYLIPIEAKLRLSGQKRLALFSFLLSSLNVQTKKEFKKNNDNGSRII